MGQYTNRCEKCIIIVKIKPLHAQLNNFAEKCQVQFGKMILLFWYLLYFLTDQSCLLPSQLPPLWTPSAKWAWKESWCFDVLRIVTMCTPIIIKLGTKFLWTSSVLFMTSFATYQINYRPTIKPTI